MGIIVQVTTMGITLWYQTITYATNRSQ